MRIFIVDVIKTQGKDSENIIRMLGEVNDRGKKQYMRCQSKESDVVAKVKQGKYNLVNAVVVNNKLKGNTGTLERFNSEPKPFVIVSQLVDDLDNVLGYKLADSQGRLSKKPLEHVMRLCHEKDVAGGIPLQNAQYVAKTKDKKGYIKAFPGGAFEKEVIRRTKNKFAQKANKVQNSNKNLEDIFTKDQLAELRQGQAEGMNIRRIANPKLSAKQMKLLRAIDKEGFNSQLLADPEYSIQSLAFYWSEIKDGMDIRNYMNPKYTPTQLVELSIGWSNGLDISKYADPKISPSEMQEVRLRLSNDMWKEITVIKDDSWKN